MLKSMVIITLVSLSGIKALSCGERSDTAFRIVKGFEAGHCQFPWAVYLRNDFNPASCTASLIHSDYVITAGHCIRRQNRNDVNPDPAKVFVILGSTDVRKPDTVRKAKKVFVHPGYNEVTLDNDIAIVQLERSVPFSSCINRLCLSTSKTGPPIDELCTVMGWGATSDKARMEHVLRFKPMMAIDHDECFLYYDRPNTKTFCDKGKRGFCHGDSGGPFVCQNKSNKRYYLHGVVSALKQECGKGPGLYTNVGYYADWIGSIIGS